MSDLEQIRANADLVVRKLRPLSGLDAGFGYNRASIEWLEGYIERLRTSGKFETDESQQSLNAVLGSFLGECVARTYGGEWRNQDGRWGVYFGPKDAVFPLSKVMKQLRSGLAGGDSILGFFDLIPEVYMKSGL